MSAISSELEILGQRILLKRTDNDEKLTEEVIALVSKRIIEAEKRAKSPKNPQNVAILALLDLAEEYILAKRRVEGFRAEIGDRLADIHSHLGGARERE